MAQLARGLFVFSLAVVLSTVFFEPGHRAVELARAGALTSVSATTASATTSASTTYTIAFTNATAIPKAGGRVHFQFFGPSGSGSKSNTINFNSATLAGTTAPSTLAIYTYDFNGLTLKTSSDIAANTSVSIVLSGVVNPSSTGYYFAHIWTTNYSTDLDGNSSWSGDYSTAKMEIGTNTNVTGTITDANGVAVSFANVNMYASNYASSYWGYTDKNGVYGFGDVATGPYTFDISYYSPATGKSYFPPDRSTVSVASSGVTTKNASFIPATKTISGYVKKDSATGSAVTNATINAYRQNASGWTSAAVDSNGNYSLQVPGGTWVAYPNPKTWPADWVASYNYDGITFVADSSAETKTKNFIVDSLSSTVTGKIVLSDNTIPSSIYSVGISFSNTKNQWFSGQLKADGTFTAQTTAGTFSVSGWVSNDLGHSFPKIDNFSVDTNATKNLGTIKLVKKADKIQGTVTDSNGAAVAGAQISAWKSEGGYDWANTTTASDGTYTLLVVPGKWQVSAWPQWKNGGSDYVYTGQPTSVTVASGVVTTKNFAFQVASNTLSVTLADPDGNTLGTQQAWISAGDGSQDWGNIGGSITNGVGTVKVPKGTWTARVYLYASDYNNPESQNVTFSGNNETKSITMKALKNNSTITGTVYDENGDKVTNKWMNIYATRGKNATWQSATLDQTKATYSMKVSKGTWSLGWYIDSSLGYSSGSQSVEITVADNETKTYDIKLKKADATIKGRATKSNGDAMQWAWITADPRDPNEKQSASLSYFSNGASSNTSGDFEFKMPAGTYFVGGSMWPGSGVINPKRQKVTVEKGGAATVDLVFRSSDATITGTTTQGDSAVSAFVTGYSEDGGYNEATSANGGGYSLAASKDTKWHIRAIKQVDKDIYKSKEAVVDLTTSTTASQDLTLDKQSYTLPKIQVITFQADQQQAITLDDGVTLTIPASAMAKSGTVTVTITPDASLAEQDKAKPINYGYDMTATDANGASITKFNANVTLEVPYVEAQLADNKVTSASELKLGYFDTAAGVWREVPNCAVNTTEKKVTCQFDHFTKFAVIAATDTTAPGAPTAVTASAGIKKVTLSWKNPTDADFASINVYRSTTSGQLGSKLLGGVTDASWENSDLTADTTYYYTLKALDVSGNESTASTQASAKPTAPATLPKTGRQSSLWPIAFALLASLWLFVQRSHCQTH